MVSRRLLRIKAMQILYAYFMNSEKTIQKAEKELMHSIQKSYDMYFYILLLLINVVDYASNKIEVAKNKKLPSPEDLNPNTKFIDNRILKEVWDNHTFRTYIDTNKISWAQHPEITKRVFQNMIKSDLYLTYMQKTTSSYEEDKNFVIELLADIIGQDEVILSTFEELSIYWQDDYELVITMLIKTFERFQEGNEQNNKLKQQFKHETDRQFVTTLFRTTITNYDEYRKLIEKYTQNWDIERIAFLDIIILQLAINEIIEFPDIPLKASFNEYIEIAKFYSTNRSATFINGILDKIISDMQKDKKIKKAGRGLFDKKPRT